MSSLRQHITARNASLTPRSVYDGRERLGSYRRVAAAEGIMNAPAPQLEPARDREWWRAEARRTKTYWSSILRQRILGQRGRSVGGRVMNALTAAATSRVPLVDAFRLRAWARGYLASIGEITVIEAVDVLQADAEAQGLVAAIGQDAVQAILAAGFAEAAP